MKSMKLIFLMMMLFTVFNGTAQKVFIDDVYFSSGKKDKKQQPEGKVVQTKKVDSTAVASVSTYTNNNKNELATTLIQERDVLSPMTEEYKQITEKAATDAELEDMKFAQTIVKNVKSNAIVVVKDKMLLGVGAGQMNRVTSARIALDWAGEKAKGAVIGSDAFFPMDDTVRLAAERGITAIAQPGGSVRDEDSINACNELGVAMYFTGNRHFYH